MSSSSRPFSTLARTSAIFCLMLTSAAGLHEARGDTPRTSNGDFEESFATIIVKNCLNCHNAADPKGGLDLTHEAGLLKREETQDL